MSRMMCALKYGCFTDYFLEEETVIHILEHVGDTSASDDLLRLSLPFVALREFLALGDGEAVARVRNWGLALADSDAEPAPDMERDTVQNFMVWFHNMQAMERSGELGAFADRPSGYIDFDFS